MTHTLHLPSIHNNAPVTVEGEIWMPPRAEAFANAWLALLSPARQKLMRYDSRLAVCAQAHAEYLSQRTGDELLQSMHVGKGGSYPNDRILDAGYRLPDGYHRGKNNTESCARDGRAPGTVAVELAAHDSHRNHMLCINGFEEHLFYGVGNAGNDYVCLTAPPQVSA